jgi:hypothetical protein
LAAQQLAELATALATAQRAGNLGDVAASVNDPDTLLFFAVRSLLFSTALVADSSNWETSLPVHEINALYRHREGLHATYSEMSVLFTTTISDNANVKPGWYWFKDLTPPSLAHILTVEALSSKDMASRSKSFDMLRRAKTPLSLGTDESVWRALGEIDPDLQDAAWAYIVDVVTLTDLQEIGRSEVGAWIEQRMGWLQAWVEAGRDLDAFLPLNLNFQFISQPLRSTMLRKIPQLSNEALQTLVSGPEIEWSQAAQHESQRRNSSPSGLGLANPSGLSPASVTGSPRERETPEMRYQRLGAETSPALRNKLDWYSLDAPEAYRLLVERGDINRETVRHDLFDKFEQFRTDSLGTSRKGKRCRKSRGISAGTGRVRPDVFEFLHKRSSHGPIG